MGVSGPRRGDVYLVELDPTRGAEIRKTRPCVVVSPDDLNEFWGTLTVAPLTTGSHAYPFRVPCRFAGKNGFVLLDQLRAVDRSHLTKRAGRLHEVTLTRILLLLQEIFAV